MDHKLLAPDNTSSSSLLLFRLLLPMMLRETTSQLQYNKKNCEGQLTEQEIT